MTQNKQPKVSKLELMRESLNQNVSSMYKIFVISMSVLFSFLITFGIIFKPVQVVSESKLNEFYGTGNLKFSVLEKGINPEQNRLVLIINTDPNQYNVTDKLNIEVNSQLRGASSDDMEMNIYKGSPEYLEMVYDNIPEEWTALRLMISESNQEPAVLMFNRKSVSEDYTLITDDTFNEDQAILRSIIYEKETLERLRIDEKETEAENYLKNIEELKSNIPELEAEKEYQTEQQKNDTDQKIRSIEQQIIILESSYNQNLFEQNELLAREELLVKKYEETKIQFKNK